jgi:Ca2+-binding RTX toxin-like protein
MLADPGSNVASTIVVDLGPGSPATTRRCARGGTQGKDTLKGSRRGDVLCGFGGNDRLRGLGGRDFIDGGTGRDVISGGPGKDYIDARDGLRDRIRPGSGVDTVRYDARLDRVKGRIERPLY